MIDLTQWRASVGTFHSRQKCILHTATPTIHLEVGSTCCVILLVCVLLNYILSFYFFINNKFFSEADLS